MSDPKVPDYWTIVHEDETVILKEELDRLRAEKAKLREALVDMIYKYELAAINAGHTKTDVRYHTEDVRAILAKTAKERT